MTPDPGRRDQLAAPSFSPQTGLFYVSAALSYSVYYLYDP